MNFGNPAAQRGIFFHLCHIVQQEQKLAVTDAGDHRQLFSVIQIGVKTAVEDFFLATHLIGIYLPAFPVGRVGKYEIELAGCVSVQRKSRAKADMLSFLTVAFEQHIRFADGVSLRVDFLPEEMNGHLFIPACCESQQSVLRNRQHTARSTSAIIARVSCILDLVCNRHENQIRHQLHNVTRCPVFTGFFIIFFVELANKLFKNGAHSVIVQAGMFENRLRLVFVDWLWAQVDIRRYEFLYNSTKNIRFNHRRNLIAEFKLGKNLLYIGRKTIQISLEVLLECLLFGTTGQVFQTEWGRITKCLTGNIIEGRPLVINTCCVQLLLHIKDCRLGIFQHCVQTANDCHGQNHVTILATNINVTQAVIGNTPNKAHYLIMYLIVHIAVPLFRQKVITALRTIHLTSCVFHSICPDGP